MAGEDIRVLVIEGARWSAADLAASLARVGGVRIVGSTASPADAGRLAAAGAEVALVDAQAPDGAGPAAARAVAERSPSTRVVAHADPGDPAGLLSMFRAGACACVPRGAPAEKLADALRAAAAGETWLEQMAGGARQAARERAGRRAQIEHIIEREQIEIAFQPIVALDTRATVGYEALARFPGPPARGPSEWFCGAHELGLGQRLEIAAVRLARRRAAALPKDAYLSVNVSPATAESAELLDLLDLDDRPRMFVEVTEHAVVGDYARLRRAVSQMRARGARFAIDDAGAGARTLSHVSELRAEVIKLDSSLTHSLEEDLGRRSLAAALIEFGRETGTWLLAEGIESELQLYELRRLGVHFGQGFHLGPPQLAPATG